jgi:ribonuclease T1
LVHAKGQGPAVTESTIAVSQLPPQGQDMMTLIVAGGPFKYDKDGVVFGNRERILPAKNRGFYREYTVKTPGERTRGARRIVCGGLKPTAPDACYYTDDHYASFRKIAQ